MDKSIKVRTPVVTVEVMRSYVWDSGKTVYDNETLLWDGELMDFAERRSEATDIFFERYNRFIPTTRIWEFGLMNTPDKVEVQEKKEPFVRTVQSKININIIRFNQLLSTVVTGSCVNFKNNTQSIDEYKKSRKDKQEK